MTAVSGEQLENSGITDIRELTSLAPSVQFQTPGGGADSSIRIRGVGTTSTNPGLESSVGVVIDGVIRARTGVALSELGDLERIEVLRGPQGTLFGRNTSSGIINILTRQPDFNGISRNVTVTLGNFNNRRISAAVNFPFVQDTLALRVEGSSELRDGFHSDANSNETLDNLDRQSVRGKLLWRPSETVSWTLSADYTTRKENCCVALLAIAGPTYNLVNQLAAAVAGLVTPARIPSIATPPRTMSAGTRRTSRTWGFRPPASSISAGRN